MTGFELNIASSAKTWTQLKRLIGWNRRSGADGVVGKEGMVGMEGIGDRPLLFNLFIGECFMREEIGFEAIL